jgi:hypothetical protein
MRVYLLIYSALFVILGTGCDVSVPPIDDPLPCVCGDDGSLCGDDWCAYELKLEENCLGQVSQAEILIDGHLEAETLSFTAVDGEFVPNVVVPCTRTEPGKETRIDVFAGKWAWSRTGNECDLAGETKVILFGCVTE